jgi:hypothetical protein
MRCLLKLICFKAAAPWRTLLCCTSHVLHLINELHHTYCLSDCTTTTRTYCPSQATGLTYEAPQLREILGDKAARRCVSKERMTILVSRLMGIEDTDSQLYVSTMLDILKRYQRKDEIPPACEFFEELRDACNVRAQEGPLGQRIALLESMIAESDINRNIRGIGGDLYSQCAPGHLVIADMTDPLLSKSDVNGLFQVQQLQYHICTLFCSHCKMKLFMS